jgi:hypothetical protein
MQSHDGWVEDTGETGEGEASRPSSPRSPGPQSPRSPRSPGDPQSPRSPGEGKRGRSADSDEESGLAPTTRGRGHRRASEWGSTTDRSGGDREGDASGPAPGRSAREREGGEWGRTPGRSGREREREGDAWTGDTGERRQEDELGPKREFRFWNLNDVLFTHTIGIFGRRGSGKTTVTMNVLQSKTIPRGLVMCPTPQAVVVYSEAVPLSYIFDYFDEDVLQRVINYQHALQIRVHRQYKEEIAQLEMDAQKDRVARWNERMQRLKDRQIAENLSEENLLTLYEREIRDEEFESAQNLDMRKSYARTRKLQLQEPYSMFCVLDDLSSDKEAIQSRVVKKLMDNGRHYLMLLIIACQYSMDFPASCRGGLDWVLIFFDTLRPNVKRLYENYVGEFADRHIFSKALEECARRNCCLVINKRSRSPDVYDSVFLFEPQELWLSTKYLGSPEYQWVHSMFYSESKFQQSMSGGSEKKKKKKEGKPPSKSFSIDSLEKKHAEAKTKGGTPAKKPAKKLPGQAQEYRPAAASVSWTEGGGGDDDDDEDEDPDAERRSAEQLQVKKSVDLLRKNLRALGRSAAAAAAPPATTKHEPAA